MNWRDLFDIAVRWRQVRPGCVLLCLSFDVNAVASRPSLAFVVAFAPRLLLLLRLTVSLDRDGRLARVDAAVASSDIAAVGPCGVRGPHARHGAAVEKRLRTADCHRVRPGTGEPLLLAGALRACMWRMCVYVCEQCVRVVKCVMSM
jgi:hypothetical protein